MIMTDSIASPTSGIVYGEIGMTTLYSRYEAAYDLVLHMDVNHLDIQNSAGYMNLIQNQRRAAGDAAYPTQNKYRTIPSRER